MLSQSQSITDLSMLPSQGLEAVLGLQTPGPDEAVFAAAEEHGVAFNEHLQQ